MVKLLIIADDFTGALDTGVQFASSGSVTSVITDINFNINSVEDNIQILVIDSETRHLGINDAYEIVFEIVKKAKEYGIPYIYKKTDSALRGNVGSELEAVLKASGVEVLSFIPAFPKVGRTTKGGIQYINEIPVHESVFGNDPFEPVINSYIPNIIKEQSSINVEVIDRDKMAESYSNPTIAVYDAESDEELRNIARELRLSNRIKVTAGCAGFANVLSEYFYNDDSEDGKLKFQQSFLVLCGSVNPITKRQLDYAELNGFKRLRIKAYQKLDSEYFESTEGEKVIEQWVQVIKNNKRCIVDTNDLEGMEETIEYGNKKNMSIEQIRLTISSNLGLIGKKLWDKGIRCTILFTGGDTLLGFMNKMGIHKMTPICELSHGTVLSEIVLAGEKLQVISKSGGFGSEDILKEISDMVLDEGGRKNVI